MNKLAMFATGCLAGMVFTPMATKTPARTLSISALASATTSFVVCLIVDTRKQNLLNGAEERASSSLSNLQKTQVELKNAESTIGKLTEDMGKMKELLSIAKKGLENCDSDSEKSRSSIANLTTRLNSLETELVSCKAELAERDADIQAMQENFEDIVQEEASKLFKEAQRNKIQEVFQEHDEITSEAMQLFRRLQGWGQEVMKRHELIKESARALRGEYARHIDEYSEKVSKERDAYLQEIEVLNERVGLLQHELNGDLLEPQLNNGFGYAIEGRIANDLAYQVFCELQIPLAVKGFCVRSDGSTEVGYGYSRSISHEVVVEALKRHSEQLARRLGIHRITSIRKLEIADLIVLTC